MKRLILFGLLFVLCVGSFSSIMAQDRFPRPEFESDYQKLSTTTPEPRALSWETLDVVLLVLALCLASWFALKLRSRTALLLLSIFSVAYFGFLREGCVCAVGAIQNITLGIAQVDFIVPLLVIAVFIIPLVFTLLFGRTFCAAVCPLGCTQDLLSVRSIKIPRAIANVLAFFPVLYLGFAVLFAATGSAFIICRYDPFVTLFRMHGNSGQVLLTVIFIILSVVIARPYCRFVCPYGVLLGWMSRLSFRHLTITPDECIDCRLCEESCPFDAINTPTPERRSESLDKGVRRLRVLFLLLPVLILASGWVISRSAPLLSRVHPRVRMAERIELEDSGAVQGTTLDSRSFRTLGTPKSELMRDASQVIDQTRKGGWILGAFLGLMLFFKLTGLSVVRKRTDYEPDKEACLSCGRCFKYCPIEQRRLKDKQKNVK